MSPSDFDELGERLGDRALVALLDVRRHPLRGGRGRRPARLHELGSSPRAADELESLHFALHRLATRHGSAQRLHSATGRHGGQRPGLDAQLLAPLVPQLARP